MFLIGTDGQPTWSYDAPDTNDLWVLPGGNLLFTTGHGVIEVTREKRVVFRYDTSEEIYAGADGNTFVGECSRPALEVDPAGGPRDREGRHGRVAGEERRPARPAGRGRGREREACHGHLGDAPLVLAITPDKKVARTYENHDALRTASSVVGLDASPRAPKGLLAHCRPTADAPGPSRTPALRPAQPLRPDAPQPRPVRGRGTLRPRRARSLRGRVPAAQGAVRVLGGCAARAAAGPRAPDRRAGRRPRLRRAPAPAARRHEPDGSGGGCEARPERAGAGRRARGALAPARRPGRVRRRGPH